ncbi:MAG: NYN domain-containing protein [Bacteroidota bacterium]
MNGLHLFIDNSNIFIEAQRVARDKYFYDDELVIRLRINYGNLLDKIRNERKLMETVLVGSRPPQNDSLWDKLKQIGIEPRIFDRSIFTNREKGVDAELSNAIRDTLEDNQESGTIAIVAGDKDYIPTLQRCLKKKWDVEIYFWGQISSELKKMIGVKFINLDSFFEEITFKQKQRE